MVSDMLELGLSRDRWENLSRGIFYHVDGTNGDDTNDGLTWDTAFQTIDHALTIWAAATIGLGDVIFIAPGDYVEELTTDLTRVSLIGVPGIYPWHIVSIRPADSYAYVGTLMEALIKNICFLSPNNSNQEFPAVQLTNARYSIIEDCHFVGRDPTPSEAGLQIGNRDAVATVANFDFCIVRRCRFDTWYGAASEFTHGIKVGRVGYDAGATVKQMVGTVIENNDIYAAQYGIYIGVYCADFSKIRYNVIDSVQHADGVGTTGIEFFGGRPMIVKNWVNALTDAIVCTATLVTAGRVLDNWIGQAGAAQIEGPTMI